VRKCRVGTKGRCHPGLLGLTALVILLASLRIRRMEINYRGGVGWNMHAHV
jgi:hypothetical protein